MPKSVSNYVTSYRTTDKSSFKIDNRTLEGLYKEAQKAKKKALLVIVMTDDGFNWCIEAEISKQKGRK